MIFYLYIEKVESLCLSGKKYKLLKYHYQMHRKVNELNTISSAFFTITNTINYFGNRYIRDRKLKKYE